MIISGGDLVRVLSNLAAIVGYRLCDHGVLIDSKTGKAYDDGTDSKKFLAALEKGDVAELRRLLLNSNSEP